MSEIELDLKPILIGNATLVPKIMAALSALMQYEARGIESYMRQNAPWQDDTGNARNGLSARPSGDGLHIGIDLFHTVPYGIWLETRFSGSYAIIVPTINAKAPEVMESCRNLMSRL